MPTPNDRSDIAERRAQLRILDIALCDELEDAGALTFQSLGEEVADRDLLHARVSDESLWEWWHYAKRRRIIEPGPNADEMSLDRGRARLEEVQRAAALPSAPKARAVVRYLMPPGLAGVVVAGAFGILSKSAVFALAALAVIALALSYWLLAELSDYLFAKKIDARVQRAWLKRTVAWLDGDEVRWLSRTVHDAADKTAVRRLHTPALPPPTPPADLGGISPQAGVEALTSRDDSDHVTDAANRQAPSGRLH